ALHNTPGNRRNERDAQSQENARKTQEQRFSYTGEESTGIAAGEDISDGSEMDRGHQASQNGVDQSPGMKDDQVRQVTSCKPCSTQRRIQRQHQWGAHVQHGAVERVKDAE